MTLEFTIYYLYLKSQINKTEHVQTSKPRANAAILISIKLLVESAVSQQCSAQKISRINNPINFIMQYILMQDIFS